MAFESGFKIFLNSYAKKKTDGTITISVEQYSGKKTAVNFFKLRNLINVEVLIRNGGMDGGGRGARFATKINKWGDASLALESS